MGRRAECSRHKAPDGAVLEGGRALLDIQERRRNGGRRARALPPRGAETGIHQAPQAFQGQAAGLRPHDGRLDPRLTTAFSPGGGPEPDRPPHCVIVLHVVDNAPRGLRTILPSRPALPPSRDRHRRTTAAVHMGAERPLAGRGCACGERSRRPCVQRVPPERQNEVGETLLSYTPRRSWRPQGRKRALVWQEEHGRAPPPRRSRTMRARATTPPPAETTPRKKAGRRQGPPPTMIPLRLPGALVTRRERDSDHLQTSTGLKAHRGMTARRAFALFLETHEPG
jgi:hypothetical protein